MSDKVLPVDFTNIPQELKSLCSFCVWKKEVRGDERPKVPYSPKTGERARINDPDTFADFGTAVTAYVTKEYDGIGFRVSEGIGAIDIDHCIGEDGSLNDVAATVLSIFKDCYFERSPSGMGLRGFFRVEPSFAYDKSTYKANNRGIGLEIYLPETTSRFVTVTGNVYRPGEISTDMEALRAVLDKFMKRNGQTLNPNIEPCSYLDDAQVINYAAKSKTGKKFRALYEGRWQSRYASHSEADLALVSMLTFWCGCEEEQIDRLFRASGLMREKWDRMSGDATYGQVTIRKAIASASNIYCPLSGAESPDMEFEDLDADKRPSFEPDKSKITMNLDEIKPHTKKRYELGEIGMGNLFADYVRPIARYNRDRGVWFVYDGQAWRSDEGSLAISELAKDLADKLLAYALKIKDDDARKSYIKRALKIKDRRNRKTMIEDAKSVHPIAQKEFDKLPNLINCQNGTLDLLTMEFRESDPEDFLTKTAGVHYDAAAACPRWERFIDEVMCGDKELAEYVQKSLGYALTGDTSLECMFILYGATSRNGKGTTMETFKLIMGEYGVTSNPELLGTKGSMNNSSGPSEDVARLNNVRFVNISEPDKRLNFSAALVKRITGNDTLNARHLHENSFDFKPVCKVFVNTNYLPNVNDTTLFDSGRLKIIPFSRHFDESEQDKGLKGFFAQEENLSGIFNWCVEGYKKFARDGLKVPEAVRIATEDYHQSSDYIGQFIAARLEKSSGYEVGTAAVWNVYKDWCEKYGYYRENPKNFNTAMSRQFRVVRKRPRDGGNTTSMFIGCRLIARERGEDTAGEDFDVVDDDAICPF